MDCVLRRPRRGRLSGSKYICSVIDIDDSDCVTVEVDFVDDSIGADPRGVESGKVALQELAYSVRVLEEGAKQVIQYRHRDLLR